MAVRGSLLAAEGGYGLPRGWTSQPLAMTKGEGVESVWIATKNAGHFSRNGRGAGNEEDGGRGEGGGCRCVEGKTGGKGAGTMKGRRQMGQGKGREKKDGEQRKVFV